MSKKIWSNGKYGVPLNEDDGWERLVNEVERQNARVRFEQHKEQHRRDKLLHIAGRCAVAAIALMALELCDLLSVWMAIPGSVALLCAGCFFFGQYWRICHADK